MSSRGGFAGLIAAALALPVYADSCVWYSDDDSIRQFNSSTGQVTRVVPLRDPHRLVMNADDCGVWTLDRYDRKLLRFNATGQLERVVSVRHLDAGLDEVERLLVDPYDGSVWITDDRRIAHLSADGTLLRSFRAPGDVRRMELALDGTLWVLGRRELWRFDAQGALLARHTLARHLAEDARYFALDSLNGAVWLADENDLARLELADPEAASPLRIRLRHRITGFALDPLSGNVWVAKEDSILAFSRAGAVMQRIDLDALEIRRPEKLAFDPVSRTLWAGSERTVSRFSEAGQLLARFRARDGDEALGVPAFRVRPLLTLIRPPQDALTNTARPEFRVGYGADCNGASCQFAATQFSGWQLSATLNGQAIGPGFQFDASRIEAYHVPAAALPEGQNRVSAQVKDGFGRSSNSVSSTFTVDTIAPRFVAVSPDDGALFQAPVAILQGTIDDPLATVVLEASGLSQTGAAFSFPVTLAPGANVFRLTATDRAGNSTTAQRTLNFIPLSLAITSPANGASVAGSTLGVGGTFVAPPNTGITVNGVVAALVGDRFQATVPLQAGVNLLTVVARTQDGFTLQQTVSVTSSGPLPIEVAASAASGLAPLAVRFEATALVGLQRIEADFDGNGTVDQTVTSVDTPLAFTYTQPGTYTARFTIVDAHGSASTQTLTIVVQDAAALDLQLKTQWSTLLQAFIARDKAAAMRQLSAGAAERYGRVFDALNSALPQIAAAHSPVERATLSASVGEYFVTRTSANGERRLFFIYFVRDADGVWRIDQM